MNNRTKLLLAAGCVGFAIYLAGGACNSERRALERVAEVEHEQWTEWSKSVAPEVSPERRARWQKYWVPYKDLPEEVKEQDREWARKAMRAARGP
jgi:hypothetical protein